VRPVSVAPAQATLSGVVVAVIPSGHPAIYDILVVLHVVTAVVGFGAVAVSGAYGALGRHADPGPETAGDVQRYFSSPARLEYLVLVAPVLGMAAMGVRPGGGEFGDVWALGGVAIWVAAGGLLTVVVRPAERRIRAAGPDPAAIAPAARRLAWAGAGSDVLFVLALFLMVTQPA
jgi:hypothetical protein